MSKSLNDADTQHIDFNGKCRILNFKNVSLAVSPLPPLNVPEVPKSETHFASIEKTLKFVKDMPLKIVEKDVTIDPESGNILIKGVWVVSTKSPPEIAFGYIPIEDVSANNTQLADISESNETLVDPIFVEGVSFLQEARANEKVAEYLKQLSIYEWAQNPEKFGENNFIVYEGRTASEYGITTESSTNIPFIIDRSHSKFYYRSKIIVPDKETIGKLLSYVSVSSLNDSHLQNNLKYRPLINPRPFYKVIQDFTPSKDQTIFIGKGSLVSWMANTRDVDEQKGVNVVHSHPIETSYTPYYYRNMSIRDGTLMLIQNTHASNFPSALAVSKEWTTSQVNVGYNPETYPGGIYVEDKAAFEVYTTEGLTHKSVGSVGNIPYTIFGYESGAYAAILFLK